MNIKFIIIGFILGLISLLILFNHNNSKHIIKTDCYDRYNNKIIGLTCEGIEDQGYSAFLGFLFIVGMVIFSIGLFVDNNF